MTRSCRGMALMSRAKIKTSFACDSHQHQGEQGRLFLGSKGQQNSFPSHQNLQKPAQERPFPVPTAEFPRPGKDPEPTEIPRTPRPLQVNLGRGQPQILGIAREAIPQFLPVIPGRSLGWKRLHQARPCCCHQRARNPPKFNIFCSCWPWSIHSAKIQLNPRHPFPASCSRRN